MARKTKAKKRLDKFYHLAKDVGYRSRASFKLIQINKKYDFLSKATCLIDLCAAPGSWLQVAAKYMPMASLKIGVDLDPIKPITGCVTFQEDITTQKCFARIRKEIKHFKADAVLNDGAPNVGAQWHKDAYTQAELSLHAMKLATEFLRRGGIFVTKVFRSGDYNSLLWVANQLFDKVDSTKPQASRYASAEIFVVCQGYKAPDHIDPKLLDPKYVFMELNEEKSNNQIQGLKALTEKRRANRGGYTQNNGLLYSSFTLKDFLETENPYQLLAEHNFIDLKAEDSLQAIEKLPLLAGMEEVCKDLKLAGRAEFSTLLKWRKKAIGVQKKEKREARKTAELAAKKTEDDEDQDEKVNEELGDLINQIKARTAKEEKKRKQRMAKEDLKHKSESTKLPVGVVDDGHYIFSKMVPSDDEEIQDKVLNGEFDSDGISEFSYNSDLVIGNEKSGYRLKDEDSDGEKEDEEMDREGQLQQMEKDLDEAYEQYKERQGDSKKKQAKDNLKGVVNDKVWAVKADDYDPVIVGKRKKDIDEEDSDDDDDDSDDEESEEKDASNEADDESGDQDDDDDDDQDDEDEEGEKMLVDHSEETKVDNVDNINMKQKIASRFFDNDVFADIEDDSKKPQEKKGSRLMANGKVDLSGFSSGSEEEEESEEDEDTKMDRKGITEESMGITKEISEREKRKLKKKRKREAEEVKVKPEFEVVPSLHNLDDYDSDTLAETLAIGHKFLRKKQRLDMIEKSFNRYTFDDPNGVPAWFLEEERLHNRPEKPVTKEEVMDHKLKMIEFNARPSKKVAEAKARKKAKLLKRMQVAKKKALGIAAQEELTEGSKMKQIQRIYSQEKRKAHKSTRLVVAQKFRGGKQSAGGKGSKLVDKRMKKEKYALQKAANKGKNTGKGGKKKNYKRR